MHGNLMLKPGLRSRVPALLSWLLLLLFLTFVLAGCSGKQNASQTLQQGPANSNKINDTQNAANNQQEASQQPKNDNQDSGQIKLIPVTVTEVVDGDTLHVKINGREEKVRLIGVNTPEIAHPDLGIKEEPYGKEALGYTQKRLDSRQVYLELDVGERDKYGRLLAYVWLEKPANDSEAEVRAKMYNAELLLNGYAQVMTVPPNVKYADLFTKLQQEAREAGKSLWGAAVTAPPPAPGGKSGSAAKYIGNSSSKKFHYPDCQWAKEISPKNRVEFNSREEAIKAGYQPCKECRPL
ncbi:thermonuclease family protein [Moorella sulfitireducens]|uniref:thermonuclease family protein n=1 Tax=Neomoorella sulfitireducens TaxID=2972948 RepID=UPI0021ABB6C8|nr:thermonuclease family protein [Moorella sulfitireducens]